MNLLDKTKLCIRASWLKNIDIVVCFNNLHKRHQRKEIFYSHNEFQSPDFLLPIRNEFDKNSDACYYAYVLKAFESKQMCIDYLYERRSVEPSTYFPPRNSTANDVTAEIERQMAIEQKVIVKREVESLRQVLLQNNRYSQTIDLTESDTEDYQSGLDEAVTIEDELNVLNEASSSESSPFDSLSGNIPYQEDSTVNK